MKMKKTMNALVLAGVLGLTMASGQAAAAEKYAWLVHKLSKAYLRQYGDNWEAELLNILKPIPKGSVIQIPAFRTASLCDFSKTVVYFKDGVGRDTMTCVYIGYRRAVVVE